MTHFISEAMVPVPMLLIANLNGMYHVMTLNPDLLARPDQSVQKQE